MLGLKRDWRPAHGEPGLQLGVSAGWALCLGLAGVALAAAAVLVYNAAVRPSVPGFALLAVWLAAAAMLWRGVGRAGWNSGMAAAGAAMVVLSFGLRWWSAGLTDGVALGADPMNYTNLARAVLDGRGLVTDDWRYGEGLRAYFPPLYPLALAGFWALFGQSALSTLAMNTLIDAAAAWALADCARRLGFVPRAAWAAGLVYLAWPAFALAAGIPQKESLTVMLVILLLRALLVWLEDSRTPRLPWRHGPRIGLWWGLLALTQPSLVLAPVAVALVVWPQTGLAALVRLGVAAALALVLVLAPWWLRNLLVLGSFVPFTTASGMMLNSALNELRAPFPPGLFDLAEHHRAAIMGEKARAILAADPIGAGLEMARNFAVAFAYEEASLARFRHTVPPIAPSEHVRLFALLQGSWLALLLAAIAGALTLLRRRADLLVVLVTAALLASIALINPWFEFGERHRLVLTPFFILLAAAAITRAGALTRS